MKRNNVIGVSTPPEGVISGDSIPRENELTEKEESLIEELANQMTENGKPYTEMSQREREKKAQKILQDNGVIS